MAEFPSEIMYDILSRMPVKSLARFRCVSKLWCSYINDPYLETMHAKRAAVNDPTLIMLHNSEYPNSLCTLSFLEYKEETDTCTLQVRKKPPVMDFSCMSPNYKKRILGSCNGLLYSSQFSLEYNTSTLVVIHPLRREFYELPPIKIPLHLQHETKPWLSVKNHSSGLGYDDSTNTFKMLCIVQVKPVNDKLVDLWTMVHVLGTDSWRKIPQVPSYHVVGRGVFANGCLHWLVSNEYDDYCDRHLRRPVISFDMEKEEFGLINPPRERLKSFSVSEHLVDLNGEVGYVCTMFEYDRMEVWVLKETGWVIHCKLEENPPIQYDDFLKIKVLGFWNENGDILMQAVYSKQMFVYNLKSDKFYEVKFDGPEKGVERDIRLYQSSLFSTRYSIIKK
ncbi:putative F-box domain-containing protein [Helianthus annuus]|uniref:F-box domain-containing protein n=1 Tax=Helianthus annuus TaxID=4232 RepID=A0A251SXM7_HELAN|nr:F-box protein CPR1 [Helianthus annuus]KAF5775146.1 putative F-box domain-containing protein [Helianthus annuus]KAJ0483066.1 putative F-box domain-containing protein [Helianthus annuus]KAJ0499224.1 putative F-box domain-containing protein [Helianthus annuus]KAJ0665240.1 putative F-box domain-containing protein [Helianthus annuus]KAJ0859998.1 putative F-box domain-containing protein [Helianthus annuus]